jgi:hypothetical protein
VELSVKPHVLDEVQAGGKTARACATTMSGDEVKRLLDWERRRCCLERWPLGVPAFALTWLMCVANRAQLEWKAGDCRSAQGKLTGDKSLKVARLEC